MSKQIDSLTSTRAIAAILVVVSHYAYQFFPAMPILQQGRISVNYFFVLSGFVMFISHYSKPLLYGNYLKKRVARIVPLYYFSLVLFLLPSIYQLYFANGWSPEHFGRDIIRTFTFTQAYFPQSALNINGPAWSLSVEAAFYISFPAFLILFKRNKNLFFALTAIIWVATSVITSDIFFNHTHLSPYLTDEAVAYHPIAHMNEFLVGMCAAYIYKEKPSSFITRIHPAIVFFTILAIAIPIWRDVNITTGLLAPLFALLIITTASKAVLLKNKALIYLGEISYGIYLLQYPVHNYFVSFLNRKLHLSGASLFIGYFITLLVVSALAYEFLEKPARDRINKWGSKKKDPISQAETVNLPEEPAVVLINQ